MNLKTQVLNISIQKIYMQYLSFVELNLKKTLFTILNTFLQFYNVFSIIKWRINIFKYSTHSNKIISSKVETIMLY